MDKVVIVIPAYNEQKRIGATLQAYGEFFNRLKKEKIIDYEILIVINNTKDKTEDIVRFHQNNNKNIKYLNLKRGGKGYAITQGFKEALKWKNELIGFIDADMATKPEAFYDLILNIKNYDGIIGSRYVKGAKVKPRQTFARIFVSRMFNFLIRTLFLMPYVDTQCGAKLFKRKVIEIIAEKLEMTQWAFDVELLHKTKNNHFRIKEHPTTWSDKSYSKINFMKSGPKMVLAIIRLRIINSGLRFLVKGYDKLPEKIKQNVEKERN